MDKLKSSKWQKVLAEAHTGGMNMVIRNAIKHSPYAHLLIEDDNFMTNSLNVHSYREVGSAVEVAIEIGVWDWNNKLISCKLMNIFL